MIADIVVLILFVSLTILFLTGHGSFLIAGYNTMSEEEKKKCDKKKVTRSMGVLFLLVDLAFLVSLIMRCYGIDEKQYECLFAGYIILIVVLFLIILNKKSKKN